MPLPKRGVPAEGEGGFLSPGDRTGSSLQHTPPIWGMTWALAKLILLPEGVGSLRHRGVTIVEALVILGVLAVLLTLAGSNLLGFRRQLSLEEAANTLSQDIQACRTRALAGGQACRLRITGEQSYVVEVQSGASYTTVTSRRLPTFLAIASPGPGAWLEFDSRTLLTPSPGFPLVDPTVKAPEIRLTNGSKAIRLVVSMVGAVKTLRQ